MNVAGIRILVVDDHPFQRSAIAGVLRTFGVVNVLGAPDAPSALSLLRQVPPVDVVICDLDLPGMDGVALIQQIAEQRSARSLILCSGASPAVQEMVATIAVDSGLPVLGYVGKPMMAPDLWGMLALLEDLAPRDAGEFPARTQAVSRPR